MQRSEVRERPEEQGVSSFDLLGKRWSALIIQELDGGPRRFREILTHLGRINDKVLSQRLKELEEAEIITRQVFAEVPIRVEYSLSDKGRALIGIVREMEKWDSTWTVESGRGQHRRMPAPEPPVPLFPEGKPSAVPVAVLPAAVPEPAAPPPPPAAAAAQPPTAALPAPAAKEEPPAPEQPRPQGGMRGFWKRFGL